MIPQAELDDLKRRNPCNEFAGRLVRLRAHGKKFIGPCPLHSKDPQARDSTSFECDADGWVCASCAEGGDVIKLAALVNGLDLFKDFPQIVKLLGGTVELDDGKRRALDKQRGERAAQAELEHNEFRDRERGRAWDLYQRGLPIADTPVADYLARRGLEFPRDVRLRFDPEARLYAEGRPRARLVHTGPAMLAALQRGGRFAGVHITFIDLAQPKAKARIVDPETGAVLPAKKMRGSKKGAHIDLTCTKDPSELILGEGIEKVLAIWTAYTAAPAVEQLGHIAFWSAGDLGNLAGKAIATVPHESLTGPSGRPLRVPGGEPDLAAPAIEIPDSVTRLVLLGDSTSDPFITALALMRARARYAKPGRQVVAAMAPAGADFDDIFKQARPL